MFIIRKKYEKKALRIIKQQSMTLNRSAPEYESRQTISLSIKKGKLSADYESGLRVSQKDSRSQKFFQKAHETQKKISRKLT